MTQSKAPFYIPHKWESVTAGLSGFGVYAIFFYLGDPGRGTIAGAFFGSIAGCIIVCRPIRRSSWFLTLMGVLTVLHVAAVLCFSWSWAARWTGLAVMPLMAA